MGEIQDSDHSNELKESYGAVIFFASVYYIHIVSIFIGQGNFDDNLFSFNLKMYPARFTRAEANIPQIKTEQASS